MKKILLLIFILMVIFIAACQQAKQDVIEKKEDAMKKAPEIPKVETTGETAVDSIGDDLTNVNNVEKDLSADELSDLDAGLADVQNI